MEYIYIHYVRVYSLLYEPVRTLRVENEKW